MNKDNESKKTIALEEHRITPTLSELMSKLQEMYPKSFNLRNSIMNPTIVFSEDREGLVYEILQDNGDGYGNYHYALYSNGAFKEIHYDSHRALVIDSQGLFFIHGSHVWQASVLYGETGKWNKRHIGYIEDRFTRWQFEHLDRLRLCKYGVYVEGRNRNGGFNLAFLRNESPGVFASNGSIAPIHFPAWSDPSTYQPAIVSDSTLFSDESSIYSIDHKTCKVLFFSKSRYPDVRLGKNYDWRPISEFNYPSTEKYPVIFIPKSSYGDKVFFLQKGRLPEGVYFTESNNWCFFSNGIISFFQDGLLDLYLYFYHTDFQPLGTGWVKVKLYSAQLQRGTAFKLVRKDDETVYFAINHNWYRITIDLVNKIVWP
ncbi:MAG: hypothetical protein V4478_01330 [Patescibacteria group bacterium]